MRIFLLAIYLFLCAFFFSFQIHGYGWVEVGAENYSHLEAHHCDQTSMLSVSIHVHPDISSALGCVRYRADCSSFDSLEVHCSGAELCVSVSSERKVLCQFCISIPEGLFKSFSASTAAKKQLCACVESDRLTGVASDCDDAQLISDFAALTTTEKDLDLLLTTKIGNPLGNDQANPAEGQKDESFAELFFCSELSNPELLDPVAADSCAPATVKEFLTDRIKAGVPMDILCAECDQTLTAEKVSFKRVEECCEGLISELSDTWFCHAETLAVEIEIPQSLYFDSACFYLPSSVTKGLRMLSLDGRRYACGACGSSLASNSRPVQGFTPFFCDKLRFRGQDSSPEDLSYRFEVAWVTLWGLIGSALETSSICKLYLHSKAAEDETCLLLRVLPQKVPWFLLQAAGDAQAHFETEDAYQVDYLVSTPSSKAVRVWRYDFDVDFYKVSDSAMSVLLRHLTEAPARREEAADGFCAALLPASLPGTLRFLNKG